MLRRIPSNNASPKINSDGPAVLSMSGGGFGTPTFRSGKFKPPMISSPLASSTRGNALPARGAKRKRISYAEDGQEDGEKDGNAGSGSDSDGGSKKKKGSKYSMGNKEYGEDGVLNGMGALCNRKFPVFEVKEKSQVFSNRFAIPIITTPVASANQKVKTITVANGGEGGMRHALSHAALGCRRQPIIIPRPLFDPFEEHAIVLYDPTIDGLPLSLTASQQLELDENEDPEIAAARFAEEEAEKKRKEEESRGPHKSLREILGLGEKDDKKEKAVVKVPVVIDPRLAKVLRPHQIEGVKFLYKCTTGLKAPNAFGCIMADEMGLGKTLQCIALMWTLLKQSPIAGKGTIEKCIIVCPSSLVRNWGNELIKWLGPGAVNPLLVDGKGGKAELIPAVRRWVAATGRSVTLPVMIVSYETLRTLEDELAGAPVGLLLADEGHRLKNADSLTFQALNTINVQRRVILSGTPIQNDLSEYFALLNFANPEYLGSRGDFRKNFELKILRGRDADASEKEREESDAKLKELGAMVNKLIIRRTNDLLSKYLPVKYEHVVFCGLSKFQTDLYRLFITSPEIQKLLRGTGSQPLKAINILQKLCNHPDLLELPDDLPGCENLLPEGYLGKGKARTVNCDYSGKFKVLERFLDHIDKNTTDKIVLISNYTQTLDLFEKMCRNKKYGCLRLDGTMNVNKRQKLVDRFNDPEGKEFVFLLSSKAGGCGINLIGANRLVLFDPAWNPASDQQALARVWRDGQKKECFVYRFQATGTIEEKIFQRQLSKQDLSSCVVDDAQDAERHFSVDNLRQLFKFNQETVCDTHDTFKCKRCRDGKQLVKAKALLYGDASSWNHYPNAELGKLHDDILRAELNYDEVTFTFQYISH